MKRLLCIVAALCLLVTGSALAQPATEAAPISGQRFYPDCSDADSAVYTFRYACPQFTVQTEADEAMNTYFASLASDLSASPLPDTVTEAELLPMNGYTYYTLVAYQITANTDEYVSVLLTNRQFLGITESESWTAVVFARDGVYAGQPVSLSQAMGLEQDENAADAQNSYASGLVYELVWQIILEQRSTLQREYFPDLTEAALENVFSPESDFYFDANGNFVFFIQAGQIASEMEGILTFPFSLAELLSAVQ